MMIQDMIKKRYQNPFQPGIKVNLYHGYEYRAMARALDGLDSNNVEMVMVGDSYFMTHLGGQSTQLTDEQTELALKVLPSLIKEVRREIDLQKLKVGKPLLMADIPANLTEKEVHQILDDYKSSGADIVKLELESNNDFWIVEAIRDRKMLAALHLGYMPQKNDNKIYGTTSEEINEFKALIQEAAKKEVSCVIFERLSEFANQILSKYCVENKILPYSIFSGRAPLGGQSLNIWDSVVVPGKPSIFFPPTSVIKREDVKELYTEGRITECFDKLVKLTAANIFPPSPRNNIELNSYLNIIEECM